MNNDEHITDILSDDYVISIPDLVLVKSYKTISDFCKILDNNGYYGRYDIKLAIGKKHTYDDYVINVYLPNSICYYNWPPKSSFNIKDHRINKIKDMQFYKGGMTSLLWYLIENKTIISKIDFNLLYDISNRTKLDYSIIESYLAGILKSGLLINGSIKIKTEMDMLEVYENVFSQKNKYILG